MLITFTSEAYENITYFEKVAQRLLNLMGHSGTVPGAIVAENISEALHNLEQGIAQEKEKPSQSTNRAHDNEEDTEISLAHRAVPLMNMLKSAEKKQCNVMWRYH